ncbi:hypothetical protein MGMO_44c00290 [Methyloglobulus morosus KoM1]|uniref:Transmembrane protein n=1 Tax=Methyloglobulus morosus KoM1 TaxID=1116472 RepID=V5BYG4_9GAMM|nr:hypothetical protein [Methyloglobulus morosus]ESS72879.1 hypothetical protein MGMO_44c00290 [Methyloglobulus morosus KoM1]
MRINIFEGARRITKLIAVLWVIGGLILQFQSIKSPYLRTYFQVDSPGSVPIRMNGKNNGCENEDATEYVSAYTNTGTEVSATLCFKAKVINGGKKLIPVWKKVTDPKILAELNSTTETHVLHKYRVTSPDGKQFDITAPEGTTEQDVIDYAKTNYSELSKLQVQSKEQKQTSKDELGGTAKVFASIDDSKIQSQYVGFEKYSNEVSSYTKKVADSFKLYKADEEWADSEVWSVRLENIKECLLIVFGGLIFIWLFSWIVGWIVRGFLGIPTGQDTKP